MRAGETPLEEPALSVPLASARLPETAFPWLLEDFKESPQESDDVDPWEPSFVFKVPACPKVEEPRKEPVFEDFWDPILPTNTEAEIHVLGWEEDLCLPNFVPHAAESPFRLNLRAPNSEDKAIQRARWLVSLLDLPQLDRHKGFERRFSELFTVYPHAATFSALADLALEGAIADDLWCAFELKEIWAASPSWWSMRRRGSRQPLIPDTGMTMLGWPLRRRP
jgi:hypothetical protein